MAVSFFTNMILLLLFAAGLVHGGNIVSYTFLDKAVADGAVCLDGSPPAYAYVEGFGDGIDNWLVYLEGGGWCNSATDCYHRSTGRLGSSLPYRVENFTYGGIFGSNQTLNVFYNWNKVNVVYCDGSSFRSNVTEPIQINDTTIYYRGVKIFDAIVTDLLSKGMGTAHNAILTGGSAGGLATYLLCDLFKSYIPSPNTRVKCLADSGFFIHAKDQPGARFREETYAAIVATHKLTDSLPKSCTSKVDPSLCLFPEHFIGDIQTPLFVVDSVFDRFQTKANLADALGGNWANCTINLDCNSTETQIIKDFGMSFIKTLESITPSPTRGIFVTDCYTHVYTLSEERWNYRSALSNKTIQQATGDWFFDRLPFQEIDTTNQFPQKCFTL